MGNLQRLLGPVSIAAVAMAAHRAWSPRFTVMLTAVVGVLATRLVVQVEAYVNDRRYIHAVTSRDGISMNPFLLALIAIAANDRRLVKPLAPLTGVALLVGLNTVF